LVELPVRQASACEGTHTDVIERRAPTVTLAMAARDLAIALDRRAAPAHSGNDRRVDLTRLVTRPNIAPE